MSVDPRAYRETAGHFATGVTLLSTAVGGQVHAMTANAFSSISLDPLLVLVAVARKARMAEEITRAEGFVVNLFRADQAALSSYFAGAWRERARPPFRFVPWEGGPRLEGCLAALGCAVHNRLEAGDHWLVLGRVLALHQGLEPRRPLLFYRGQYHQLASDTGVPAPALEDGEEPPQPFYESW